MVEVEKIVTREVPVEVERIVTKEVWQREIGRQERGRGQEKSVYMSVGHDPTPCPLHPGEVALAGPADIVGDVSCYMRRFPFQWRSSKRSKSSRRSRNLLYRYWFRVQGLGLGSSIRVWV